MHTHTHTHTHTHAHMHTHTHTHTHTHITKHWYIYTQTLRQGPSIYNTFVIYHYSWSPTHFVHDNSPSVRRYTVFSGGFRDSPEWGIALPMVTVFLYDEYNDTDTLTRFYPNMVRYIDYLTSRADPKSGLVK